MKIIQKFKAVVKPILFTKPTPPIDTTPQGVLQFVELISNYCGGLKGKKIFEVGVDATAKLISPMVSKYNAQEAIGINLTATDTVISDRCKIFQGDVRETVFEDNYFDVIISSAVFEHVHNFDIAIKEMHRILRPGGHLYAAFGPIWSTSYGHHLWTHIDGKLYNYWNFILPPYCHLIMSPDELLKYCIDKTADEELSRKIVEYVYESEEQNQLLFEDYENIINNSDFEVLFLKGYDHPELPKKYINQNFPDIMSTLKERFPDNKNFLFDGIEILLKKS